MYKIYLFIINIYQSIINTIFNQCYITIYINNNNNNVIIIKYDIYT